METTQRDELALFLAQRDAQAGSFIRDRADYEELADAILAKVHESEVVATR